MPRWLLEQHLELLYAELVSAIPAQQARYALLRDAGQMLRAAREAAIPTARFQALSEAWGECVGPALQASLPEAGALAVAAVADERGGVVNTVASVASWLADPGRFPPVWTGAIHATIAAARAS